MSVEFPVSRLKDTYELCVLVPVEEVRSPPDLEASVHPAQTAQTRSAESLSCDA